jgi:hypothetical protein
MRDIGPDAVSKHRIGSGFFERFARWNLLVRDWVLFPTKLKFVELASALAPCELGWSSSWKDGIVGIDQLLP